MSRRVVPQQGVRWGEGDLIPPDSLRRCKVCKQPIEHLSAYRVTCGHPRCQRTNRAMATKKTKHLAIVPSPEPNDVERMWRFARSKNVDPVSAYTWIARKTGKTIRQVMAEIKEIDG